MRKFLLVVAGLSIFGALGKAEAEEDGAAIARSPFLAALAIKGAILLLPRERNNLLNEGGPVR